MPASFAYRQRLAADPRLDPRCRAYLLKAPEVNARDVSSRDVTIKMFSSKKMLANETKQVAAMDKLVPFPPLLPVPF